METKLAIFKGKEIRRTLYDNEWWFSVVDICAVLTNSRDAAAYWRKLKQRLKAEGSEVVTICHGLKLIAPDGKNARQIVLTPKAFFESFNPFLPLKPSLSSAG
jgi:prophage antirepressor-like protein